MRSELDHVSLTLDGLPIIDDLSLTLETGFTAVIGPSGAGKTTILKLLLGILAPTSGTVTLDGQPITGIHQAFAYMPQDAMLLPWYTVAQNITLYQRLNHLPVAVDQVSELLTVAGLAQYRDFRPGQLSGGMKQRVAFMRTVMNPAGYRLLDEPFGALDAMTRQLLQDWLLALPAAYQRPTLMVTHDIDEAIYLADRIIVLSKRPAKLLADIKVTAMHRDRRWLAQQAPLKAQLYEQLREESYVGK